MRQSKYTQIRVVQNKDPGQFQSEFNRAQIELQSKKPQTVKIEVTQDGIIGVIQYECETEVPETAQDELLMQGLHFTCEECPRFEPVLNLDGSVKRTSKQGSCFLEDRAWRDSCVCEWFCKQFLRGEIRPVGGMK